MSEAVDVTGIRRQTARAANSDGVSELLAGLAMVIIGAVVLAHRVTLLAPIIVVAILPGRLAIRRWITHPRIGYYESRAARLRAIGPYMLVLLPLLFVSVALVVLADDVGSQAWAVRVVPVVVGLVLASPCLALGRLTGLGRYYALAALGALCGLGWGVAWAMPGRGIDAVAYVMLTFGGLCVVCGIVALVCFVATHPRLVPEGAADDR